jgi:hypothetical protein
MIISTAPYKGIKLMKFFDDLETRKLMDRQIAYGREDDDWGDYVFPELENRLIKNCSNCEHPRTWCTCSEAEKRVMRKKARQAARTKKNDKFFNK